MRVESAPGVAMIAGKLPEPPRAAALPARRAWDRVNSPGSAFRAAFAEAWKRPTPAKLTALLHEDVVLYQPHRPPVRGKADAYVEFARLLEWLPGIHGVVERSTNMDGTVFIEWQMRIPAGDRVASIRAVDRLSLEEGLAIERAVYFDRLALLAAVLSRPRSWWGYLKYRYGP